MYPKKKLMRGLLLAAALFFLYITGTRALAADRPELITLYVQEGSGVYDRARITFDPGRASDCYIYRKMSGGHYRKIGEVHSSGTVTSYTDEFLPKTGEYIYTVRSQGIFGDTSLSGYDSEGLATIRGKSTVKATLSNLRANISWTPNPDASSYAIYRQIDNGSWLYLASVSRDRSTYTDYYSQTFTASGKTSYLLDGCYFDLSMHCLSYTVRAVRRYLNFNKRSLSPYEADGYFNLNAPTITSASRVGSRAVTITFSSVYRARSYLVSSCRKKSDGSYERRIVASLSQSKKAYIDCTFLPLRGFDYVTVTAVSRRNGEDITKRSIDGFNLTYPNYSHKKILYIGDSITYGSPYKSDLTRYVFSYPWRVGELTHASYYNAAIPGATLAYRSTSSAPFHRYRIVSDVVPALQIGTTPVASPGLLEENSRSFKDFDTIVICAGTNDYTDLVPLGTIGSEDETTYYGAFNILMQAIEQADSDRVSEGRSHLTVILPDLFYSDRCSSFTVRRSRYKTKNQIGLTLKDYNDAKNKVLSKYKKRGLDTVRFKTSSYVNQRNCAYTTADNLHMTRYTYEKIGNDLASLLIGQWSR